MFSISQRYWTSFLPRTFPYFAVDICSFLNFHTESTVRKGDIRWGTLLVYIFALENVRAWGELDTNYDSCAPKRGQSSGNSSDLKATHSFYDLRFTNPTQEESLIILVVVWPKVMRKGETHLGQLSHASLQCKLSLPCLYFPLIITEAVDALPLGLGVKKFLEDSLLKHLLSSGTEFSTSLIALHSVQTMCFPTPQPHFHQSLKWNMETVCLGLAGPAWGSGDSCHPLAV